MPVHCVSPSALTAIIRTVTVAAGRFAPGQRRGLGSAPVRALFEVLAGPLAQPTTSGVRFGPYRTVSFDGCSSLKVPDSERNRGWPGRCPHGGYPQVELMTLFETGPRAVIGAVSGPQLGQQDGQGGLPDHEHRHALPSGQSSQPRMQIRLHPQRRPAALMRSRRGTRTIHRQNQLLWQTRQPLPPVGHLPGQHTARVIGLTQQRPLPQGVVRVLHRQRLPPPAPAPHTAPHRPSTDPATTDPTTTHHLPRDAPPAPTPKHHRHSGTRHPRHQRKAGRTAPPAPPSTPSTQPSPPPERMPWIMRSWAESQFRSREACGAVARSRWSCLKCRI